MIALVVLIVPGIFGSQALGATRPARPPNIVVIVADDLGWNAVGYHDGFVRTPNIDRIARSGVQLDRFYVSPMCSPTRAGVMTGRYALRLGMGRAVVRPWARYGLPPEEVTLAEALAEAGYTNRAAVGKWHLGHLEAKWHPLSQGFTHYTGGYNGASDYWTRQREGEIDWHVDATPMQPKGYTTDLIADAAVGYIQKFAASEPFLCYVAFTAPHDPFQAPEKYLPASTGGDDAADGPQRTRKRTLAAMIACLDDGIGRILRALSDQGLADNTMVWFLSDNGGVGGVPGNNQPLHGTKLSVYEGGVRVPAAVWWPGVIDGGRTVRAAMSHVDVLPTLVRVAGGKPPSPALDGQDMFDVLTGGDPHGPERDLYFFTGQSGLEQEQLAITSADGWKLVVIGPDIRREAGYRTPAHRVELYHLARDPFERHDTAAREPERVRALAEKLIVFRASEPEGALTMVPRPAGYRPPPDWRSPLSR